ncbi:MAG: hypothetical protein ACI37O_07795 [Candidatus Avelusimicrobium sp.]|uniref:hypothetical protein n=1 Tax=Candidatus Avelusimicrobium sp. TaxID=3048833 RepID=UPI003F07D5CA
MAEEKKAEKDIRPEDACRYAIPHRQPDSPAIGGRVYLGETIYECQYKKESMLPNCFCKYANIIPERVKMYECKYNPANLNKSEDVKKSS